jgi:hypothetical protein
VRTVAATLAAFLLSTTAQAQYNALGMGFKPCSWLNSISDNWRGSSDTLSPEDVFQAWLGGYVTGINMTLLELGTNGSPRLSLSGYKNSQGLIDVTGSLSVTPLAAVVHEKCRRFPDMQISNAAANAISFFTK